MNIQIIVSLFVTIMAKLSSSSSSSSDKQEGTSDGGVTNIYDIIIFEEGEQSCGESQIAGCTFRSYCQDEGGTGSRIRVR